MSAGRISEIVSALKAYSYLDQAPAQAVNVHEGLDNTLLVLAHKLKSGISVRKEYAPLVCDPKGHRPFGLRPRFFRSAHTEKILSRQVTFEWEPSPVWPQPLDRAA